MRRDGRKYLFSNKWTDQPGYALVGVVRVPQSLPSPARAIVRRIGYALTALALAVFIVYLDRAGYTDAQDDELSLLDCFYYAAVSLSTTGYGDVTPITPQARLVNVLLITPLRIFFLIVRPVERYAATGRSDATSMNKTRAAMTIATVGVLVLLGGGVANASPPGFDPYAGLPIEIRNWLQPILAEIMHFLGLG